MPVTIAGPASGFTPQSCGEPVRVSLRPGATGGFFAMRFAAPAPAVADAGLVEVPLAALDGADLRECWDGAAPLWRSIEGGIAIVATASHLLAHVQQPVAPDADISAATRSVYARLLGRIFELGYPHLVRVWNFIPDINRGSGDGERYVRFNHGRAAAIAELGFAAPYPAATCVGAAPAAPFTVAILASRVEPLAVENPRQTSSWHYPRRYGPRPPAFARAMLLPDREGARLFISGTASIVGHESRHRAIGAQLEETLANVAELTAAAAQRMPGLAAGPRGSWRVYLRDPADLACVAPEIRRRLGGPEEVVFLQADICRRELLVEVEGFCGLTRTDADAARS